MLITLVENAIKHGIEPMPQGGRIDVTARCLSHPDGARIVWSVVDTGAGLVGAPCVHGIGLANIRERLALQYGPRAVLETEANDPRGFVARLVLPLDPVPVRASIASLTESAAR
jgi:sensor histidine kinase YesM